MDFSHTIAIAGRLYVSTIDPVDRAPYGTFRIMSSWAWRIPSIIQALSSIIQIFCFWWIVESPRWLVSKDYCDEAQAIITRVSSLLSLNVPDKHTKTDPQCSIMLIAIPTIQSYSWSSKRSKKLDAWSKNRQLPGPISHSSKLGAICFVSSSF